MSSPLIQDVCSSTTLSVDQVEGAVGLALTKLQTLLDPQDFQTVRSTLPEADRLIGLAPKTRKSFLGSLAGGRAALLLELNQGLSQLGIPTAKQKPLANALTSSIELHHPELVHLFEKVKG